MYQEKCVLGLRAVSQVLEADLPRSPSLQPVLQDNKQKDFPSEQRFY